MNLFDIKHLISQTFIEADYSTLSEKNIQIVGVVLSILYGIFIVWLYAAEPKSFSEFATKASVTAGTYEVDKVKLDEGLRLFRAENYPASRDFFAQADPEKRDPKTQYYTAYSFYRQGFGKVYNDDLLFKQGLETVARVDPNLKIDDENLKLKTAAELKSELQEGLQFTAADINPLKVFRERK